MIGTLYSSRFHKPKPYQIAVESAVIAAAYVAAGKLGLLLAIRPGLVTPVWPPSGIALAVILLRGKRVWPGIFIGSFVLNFWTSISSGIFFRTSFLVASSIAAGSTFQALAGAYFIRRFIRSFDPFEKFRDVFSFTFIEAGSCLISPTFGVTSLYGLGLIPIHAYFYTWWTWWLGDFVGIIIVAPLLLTWSKESRLAIHPNQIFEGLVLYVLLLTVCTVVFGGFFPHYYVILPLMIWATCQFGQIGVAVTVLTISVAAVGAAYHHTGPFAEKTLNQSLLLSQAYVGIIAVTAMTLAAALRERLKTEMYFKESEEKYRWLIENSTEAIWLFELRRPVSVTLPEERQMELFFETGYLTECNDAMAKVYGYQSGKEMVGMRLDQLMIPSQPENREYLRAFIQSGYRLSGAESVEKDREGNNLYFLNNLAGVIEDGKLVRAWGTSRDITELKRSNEALANSNQDLEQFAYVASHDLQEPLRTVSGLAQLILQKFSNQLDPEGQELLALMSSSAARAQQLVNDLLEYARIDKRKELARVDCNHVLETVITNLNAAIKESQATITHDPLPELVADEIQLQQLLQNLIANAIKFRRDVPLRIYVSAREEENRWLWSVQDNGIGIEPDYRERIFVIFQRLHNEARYPGTGIGLALCKKIVERHGGKIWVHSKFGEGATFYFTLPKR